MLYAKRKTYEKTCHNIYCSGTHLQCMPPSPLQLAPRRRILQREQPPPRQRILQREQPPLWRRCLPREQTPSSLTLPLLPENSSPGEDFNRAGGLSPPTHRRTCKLPHTAVFAQCLRRRQGNLSRVHSSNACSYDAVRVDCLILLCPSFPP